MGDAEDSMPAWAVRLETKVDLVLGQHGTRLEDHETRLRIQESRRFVSPAQLWGGVLAALAGASALTTLLNWLIGLN
ncbi:hypothetical protein [Agromyces sp. CF514]|uniref:hypothetical protein n=1 Tax=Agromyces sp. CF514 TaxID=1881031 RepID=UPI000B8608DD|nr:hypothetical protein [Agromyces sp. CF514]